MNKKIIQGECLCRTIQFQLVDDFTYAFYCHCSLCRKRTGSVFAAIGGIESEKIMVTQGEALIFKEGETIDGYRAICSKCFVPLFSVLMDRKRTHVNLGSLINETSRKPDHHIYVASKATWYEIQDSLPQYDELPTWALLRLNWIVCKQIWVVQDQYRFASSVETLCQVQLVAFPQFSRQILLSKSG